VPESTILGLQPGEAFVHRNIAAAVGPSDISALAVVEYAVRYLKIENIILSGHTNCGGCVGTLAGAELGGVLDSWLAPLGLLYSANEAELTSIEDPAQRAIRLAEIGVESGVNTIMNNVVVKAAMAKRGLQVHGTIYNTGTGLLRDMNIGTSVVDESSAEEQVASPPEPVEPKQRDVLRGNHGVLVFNDDGDASMGIQ
jgi:carbonic anhydrase